MLKDLDTLFSDPIFSRKDQHTDRLQLKDGELRFVSVMYADLVGFTNICSKLTQEETQLLLDKILTSFTQTVHSFGGEISRYAGDQIMALFGAKIAKENDLERTLLCSMEIQKSIQKINEIIQSSVLSLKIDRPFNVRVGINYGEVATGKVGDNTENAFTVYGDVVNLAARMESNAPIGRIMLPKATAQLVVRYFNFEEIGELTLKGFAQKIPCVLLEGFREKPLVQAKKTAFIGRQKEWLQMEDIFSKAKNSLQWIVVSAPAGLGKSRLVNEFINSKLGALTTDCFFKGSCYEIEGLAESGFSSMIKKGESITHESVSKFIDNLSKKSHKDNMPAIVLLEDIHWADNETKQIINGLYEKIKNNLFKASVLFVFTTRNISVPFVGDFCHQIILNPLELNEITSLVGDEAAYDILKRSGGNPLYLEELINLSQTGNQLPTNAKRIIIAKIDSLNKANKRLVQVASVLGDAFHISWLNEVTKEIYNEDYPILLDGPLQDFFTSQQDNTVSIKHQIIKEAIYNTILDQNKSLIHNTIGNYFEKKLDGKNPKIDFLLGHHYFHGANLKKAIPHMFSSAHWAIRTQNYARAKEIYTNLRKIEDLEKFKDIEKYVIRRGLAQAEAVIGSRKTASTIYQEAFKFVKPENIIDTARLLNRNGFLKFLLGNVNEALEDISRAKDLFYNVEDLEGAAWAHLHLAKIYFTQGNFNKSKIEIDESCKFKKDDKPNITFTGHELNALIALQKRDFVHTTKYLELAQKTMQLRPTSHFLARIHILQSEILFVTGDFEQAISHAKSAALYGHETFDKELIYSSEICLAKNIASDDESKAIEILKNVLEKSKRDGLYLTQAWALKNLTRISKLRNNFDETILYAKAATEIFTKYQARIELFEISFLTCMVYIEKMGEPDNAWEQITYMESLVNEAEDKHTFIRVLFLKANFYYTKLDFKNALNFYNAILEAQNIDNIFLSHAISLCLSLICCLRTNDFKASSEKIKLINKLDVSKLSGKFEKFHLFANYLYYAYTKQSPESYSHFKNNLLQRIKSNIPDSLKFEYKAILCEGMTHFEGIQQSKNIIEKTLEDHPIGSDFKDIGYYFEFEQMKRFISNLLNQK